MKPLLRKLKTRIISFLGHDIFAVLSKNKRQHLQYIKFLKLNFSKPEEMTIMGNYEVPSKVIESLDSSSTIITGGVEFHIDFEESLDKLTGASFHFFEVDARSIEWFRQNKKKSNFKIIDKGLGSKKGTLPVYGNEFMGFSSSVDPKIYESSSLDFQKIGEAEITTVHDYCLESNISAIDILKLDIEGMALEVTHACWENNLFPKNILLEVERGEGENFSDYKSTIERFISQAQSLDYQIIFMERKDFFNSQTCEFFLTKNS
jgi:FkbM family methyltransferase|tara:strand:- start:3908 stop:4693 length:786 start_codon:yes stop_codon:yes gene_type:complete